MIGVITGDIIGSGHSQPEIWLDPLKEVLCSFGDEGRDWMIFRGDSFQIELPPENLMFAALIIKAGIVQLGKLDIRMGLGIGEKTYEGETVAESSGSAFLYSGRAFESLMDRKFSYCSHDQEFDLTINLVLRLVERITDEWTAVSARTLAQQLMYPDMSQDELASILGKGQSSISRDLKRAAYDELLETVHWFISIISKQSAS